MNWNVETASKEDANEISALYGTVWPEYRHMFSNELMENRMSLTSDVMESMRSKTFFIVRDKKKIIGVARATLEHGACLLDRMVVHLEYQKNGVGKTLTERIIQYAKENGAHKVWLDTSPKLVEAVKLYEGMGFQECGFFRKHYWGEDIKFYELIL